MPPKPPTAAALPRESSWKPTLLSTPYQNHFHLHALAANNHASVILVVPLPLPCNLWRAARCLSHTIVLPQFLPTSSLTLASFAAMVTTFISSTLATAWDTALPNAVVSSPLVYHEPPCFSISSIISTIKSLTLLPPLAPPTSHCRPTVTPVPHRCNPENKPLLVPSSSIILALASLFSTATTVLSTSGLLQWFDEFNQVKML